MERHVYFLLNFPNYLHFETLLNVTYITHTQTQSNPNIAPPWHGTHKSLCMEIPFYTVYISHSLSFPTHTHTYTHAQRMFCVRFAKLQGVSIWGTLSKKCYINLCPIINCYTSITISIFECMYMDVTKNFTIHIFYHNVQIKREKCFR
jgi:hypothetical protein